MTIMTRLGTLSARAALTALITLAALSGVLAACGGGADSPPPADPQDAPEAQPAQPAAADQEQADDPAQPFKLGIMLDFTGGLAEYGNEMRRGFDLAIKHLNAAGGVRGRPIETYVADSTLDPTVAVEEARRLIEVEGIHAFVCCTASSISLAVSSITSPARIPQVSPSATSPQLTLADDDDFLFRSTLSDAAQGPILAQLAADRGYDNVGLIYRNDAWGQGYAATFADAWDGELVSIATDPAQTTFIAELQQSAAEGAQALIVVTFVSEAEIMIREALEQDIYDQFVFSNGAQSPQLITNIGAEYLAGMYGVGPASASDNASAAAWLDAYVDEYGEPPALPYVRETYDAAIALALAAEAAGSNDGTAIRDALRSVGGAPGEQIIASPDSLARAIAALAEGAEIDIIGSATALDWDKHGDLSSGYTSIWRYTENNDFEELEIVPYQAE